MNEKLEEYPYAIPTDRAIYGNKKLSFSQHYWEEIKTQEHNRFEEAVKPALTPSRLQAIIKRLSISNTIQLYADDLTL